jgi:hypothetical protein
LASNLTTIGLVADTEDSFDALMQRLASSARERLASDPGDYSIWRSATGAEVWFHVTGTREPDGQLQDHEIIGFTPFFEGMSDVDIEIDAGFQRPGENPFEGAFKAWVAPDPANGRGVHPIVFDCVDFAAHRNRELPIRCHAKLTAFARQLTAYADENDYYDCQPAGQKHAGRAFVPLGLRGTGTAGGSGGGDDPDGAPSSVALLIGSVVEHRVLTDPEGGTPYHWLLVDSLGATFDVVADPSVITGTIVDGSTVEVRCVVFGRLID